MRALATWCVRHRRLVAGIWLAAFVIVTLISRSVGSAYTNTFSLPNTESTQAIKLLQKVSPGISGDQDQVVFQTSGSGGVANPAVKERIDAMLRQVERLPHVTQVVSPYQSGVTSQISVNGHIAFATIPLTASLRTSPPRRPTAWSRRLVPPTSQAWS